ncbi:class I SAM-dependent methyltransferase [Chitinophaga agrisoli]|uniref:Class I SAM-dependent methyltransferase n=1 Tax=Chitinophaga agrisoli TaxID=2607653 RepID=A0A5B2VJ66_9BACT|nr:methyltransferase domain-containing protein [Chitinophaga agrisoli]KAA2238985.1 class I SAM-dependent methyltransferase [Chitinophaga agrisoli]
MAPLRKPLQGVWNIVRFNWHFYALSAAGIVLLLGLRAYLPVVADVLLTLILATLVISLGVSCYIYDYSGLYNLSWLGNIPRSGKEQLVNIHAGFDETSVLLQDKFPQAFLSVFDFYDPLKHTEVSIKRARKAYPAFPGTQAVQTDHLPMADHSADKVFALLAAHEVRDEQERQVFFKEINRILQPQGYLVVTEHLRDPANFFVYNIGAFHFHSRATWLRTFTAGGFSITQEIKITPFIHTFILRKHGTTA